MNDDDEQQRVTASSERRRAAVKTATMSDDYMPSLSLSLSLSLLSLSLITSKDFSFRGLRFNLKFENGKLAKFRIKELKDVLNQLGLSKQGKKQDLVDRILSILSDE
ncbi:hypothetical protein ACSBR1_005283 [Camellia fascicularis]